MNQIIQLLFPFISSLIIASLIIPSWIQLCSKWNLFDRPDTRKHHTAIIPSLGGIGIFIAIMISIFCLDTTIRIQVFIPLQRQCSFYL
ncbi:MAG: hypothetical protein IPJ93_07045 [Bacteroidota bacterium]|nr:MAG: hypothetical protein IPJ93_07045 [Bacteroidota bacterium]